jgi:membrane protease YdiL (CAAX protease family)
MSLKLAEGDKQNLGMFFLIAFGWSWFVNLPRILAAAGWCSIPAWLSTGLGYIAVLGPSLAAFGLTGWETGKEGIGSLWRRGWQMRFYKNWLLPAIVIMPCCGLLTLGMVTAMGGRIPWELASPPSMLVPVGLLIWLFGALPEEYGWRGYALDRLQKQMTPLTASLVLGLVWSMWHLPLHFIPGTTQAAIPVWEFSAQMVILSILYTWLHNHSGGSILVAGIFHAMGNITGALLPTWATPIGRWMGMLPLLAIAAIILLTKGLDSPARFTPAGEAISPISEVNLEWRLK